MKIGRILSGCSLLFGSPWMASLIEHFTGHTSLVGVAMTSVLAFTGGLFVASGVGHRG